MAAIRIFLLTCRRPQLLPRALASLRAQTFRDWTCELHNDAPEDNSPGNLVAEINDPRITLHQHTTNWGAVATFNHAFAAAGPEMFASILEDDNWWEAEFLTTAHAALLAVPDANLAWANLRLWQEKPDGSWNDTGRTIWKTSRDQLRPVLFHWPQPLQLTEALHSNGALLFRARPSGSAQVPPSTPIAIIEPVRERLLPGGWLFLPQVLGNFAVTLRTARSQDRAHWAQSQLLVAASYLENVSTDNASLRSIWSTLRSQTPPSTTLLFHLALAGIRPLALLRHARFSDWIRFLAGAVRHPIPLFRALRFRRIHAEVWEALNAGAHARTLEASRRSPTETSRRAIFNKSWSD